MDMMMMMMMMGGPFGIEDEDVQSGI